MLNRTVFSNIHFMKAFFRFHLARIRQVLLLMALLISLVGIKPNYANAAQVSGSPAAENDTPWATSQVLPKLSQTLANEQAPVPGCPTGMLSYWKLNETAGQVFNDIIRSNNAGCPADNCPGFTTGHIGGALDFNGTSHWLEVSDDASLDWASDASFSIELWANFTDVSSRNRVMIGREEEGGTQWWLGANQDTGYANFNLLDANQAGVSVTGSTPLNDGQWHHLVAVRDDSLNENRLYVDGQLVDARTHDYTAGFESVTGLGIGYMVHAGTPDYLFAGRLDEMA